MAEYRAKVRVKRAMETVVLLANSREEALEKASKKGRVMSIKRSSGLASVFATGMVPSDRIVFLRRLAAMIRSKVGTSNALRIMAETFSGRVSKVSNTLLSYVENGEDFTEALDSMPKDFPSTTIALIKAGMRGSDIYKALNDAATFEIEMDRIRRSSGKDLISAMISFFIGMAVIIGCSEFLGPYILSSELLEHAGQTPVVVMTFAVADILGKIMIAMSAFFFALFILRFVVKPMAPGVADRITLKLPIYRDLMLAQNNYATFYGIGLLVRSGVQMEHALKLSAETAPKGEIRADLERALAAARLGKPWAPAMKNLHPTDIAALSTSMDRSEVADSMDAIAMLYKETFSQRIGQVVPTLQMLAAFFMSAGGAIMFGMIVLPILQMGEGIL